MIFRHRTKDRARRLALVVAALAASALIAACGGSGSSASSTRSTRNATSSRSAFVKCLKQHGVTPPSGFANGTRPKHSGTPPTGGGFAANPTLRAAFKACGANRTPGNPG